MRLAVKKLEVRDPGELVRLVTENIESLEQGLTVIDSRLLLGHATIDVAAVDANGTLVLIALGRTADEAMLLSIVDAYSWCLEYPEAVRRVHPALRLSPERPPRVLFVVERMPDSFQRKMKQLNFRDVGCVEFRHIEVNGVRAVLFDCVAQLGQPLIAGPAPVVATASASVPPVPASDDAAPAPSISAPSASAAGIQAALEHAIASAASRLAEAPEADGTGLRAILDEIAKARLEPMESPSACEPGSEIGLEAVSRPVEPAAPVEVVAETFSPAEMDPRSVLAAMPPALVLADESAIEVNVPATPALELELSRTLQLESIVESLPTSPEEIGKPSATVAPHQEVSSSIKLVNVVPDTPAETPVSAPLHGLLDEVTAPAPAEPATTKPVPTLPAWAKAPATAKPADGARFPAPPTAARTTAAAPKPAEPVSIAPAPPSALDAPAPATPGAPEATKERGAELPAEFDNLKFPKDGVLTRQWMEFLNQMAASK
jgi:hypothetical protein